MLLSLCSITSYAYDFEVDGLYYNLISASEKTCELVGGKEGLTSVIVPASVSTRGLTLSVKRLGANVFENNASISKLEIQAPIEVSSSAFSGCTNLADVRLSDGVTTIGEKAFYNCPIDSLYVPNTVLSIGENAINLVKTVYLADGKDELKSYGPAAAMTKLYMGRCIETGAGIFFNNDYPISYSYYKSKSLCGRNLCEVSIGSLVQRLDESLFESCYKLKYIFIPKNITNIEENVFKGCTALNEICFEDSESAIEIYYTYEYSAINWNFKWTGGTVFPYYHYYIKGVRSPFVDASLKSVYIGRDIDYHYSKDIFLSSGISGGNYIYMHADYEGEWNAALLFHASLKKVEFGPKVKSICPYMFYGQQNPDVIAYPIPSGITGIGTLSYANSSISRNITLNGVKSIGSNVFKGCKGIKSVDLGNSIQTFGENVFSSCTSLRKADLGSLEILRTGTFKGCASLTWLRFGEKLTTIKSTSLNDCVNLTQIGLASSTPPAFDSKSELKSLNTWDVTLYIPHGTTSNYEAANVWKDFPFKEEQDIPEFVAPKPNNVVNDDVPGNYIMIQPTNEDRKVTLATNDNKAKYQWYKYVEKTGEEIEITNNFHSASGWRLSDNSWDSNMHEADSAAILNYECTFNAGDELSFDWHVSSEDMFDQLQCYLGDELLFVKSGESSGSFSKKFDASKTGMLSFVYVKDNCLDVGNDNAIIRNLKIQNSSSMTMQIPEAIANETNCELSFESATIGDKVFCIVTLGDGRQIKSNEFVIEYLNFIKTQPTANNLRVELDTPDPGAKYQWYKKGLSEKTISPISSGMYAWTEQNGVWTSGNKGIDSSTSGMTARFNVDSGDVLTFDWTVSSQSSRDYLTVSVDGVTSKMSGVKSGTYEKLFERSGEALIEIRYTKDASGSSGSDCATVSNMRYLTSNWMPIEGAISAQFTGSMDDFEDGDVVCCEVILSDGRKLTSDKVTISKSGIDDITLDSVTGYTVYNLNGIQVLKTMDKSALDYLPSGIYIINGQKVLVK